MRRGVSAIGLAVILGVAVALIIIIITLQLSVTLARITGARMAAQELARYIDSACVMNQPNKVIKLPAGYYLVPENMQSRICNAYETEEEEKSCKQTNKCVCAARWERIKEDDPSAGHRVVCFGCTPVECRIECEPVVNVCGEDGGVDGYPNFNWCFRTCSAMLAPFTAVGYVFTMDIVPKIENGGRVASVQVHCREALMGRIQCYEVY